MNEDLIFFGSQETVDSILKDREESNKELFRISLRKYIEDIDILNNNQKTKSIFSFILSMFGVFGILSIFIVLLKSINQ